MFHISSITSHPGGERPCGGFSRPMADWLKIIQGEYNMAHDDSQTCACGGNCACQSESQVYLTPAEYVARLEQYLADLKAEIVSVEAELAALRAPAEV